MKLRFVLMGPDDDRHKHRSVEGVAAVREGLPGGVRYQQRGAEIIRREHLNNGRLKVTALANFYARIVRDLILDDGEHEGREFEIEAEVGGHRLAFTLGAAEFARMGWVLSKLGPKAIIYPGQQQHVRAAIQSLSGSMRQERIFTHLGWRKHNGQWIYLHACGALSAEGPLTGVQVRLPAALKHFRIRAPSDPGSMRAAVRASLRCLSLAPDRISFPMFAAVYRAPLGSVDLSLFLAGKSGVFKTALAAVCQQHFGAEMDADRLPTNFASTANAIEELSFSAKDALLTVDDFTPTGRYGDSILEGIAERIFRGAGNHQGRNRMSGGGQLSPPRPPRSLMLATGEEVPKGHSIRARLVIVEVGPGEVDRAALTECQRAGKQGRLSQAMGGFVCWIGKRYEELRYRLETRVEEIRSQGHELAVHARVPSAVAELQTGCEIFLEFAAEVGAIDTQEQAELTEKGKQALGELAARQRLYLEASDPASRFVTLLRAALASGQAHVADRQGRVPKEAAAWGWQRKLKEWAPRGTRIGWLIGSDLFLEASSSYQVAQMLAGAERIAVGQQTLHHRLKERGLLASVDAGRQMVQVRSLEGCPRQVLHLKLSALLEDSTGVSDPLEPIDHGAFPNERISRDIGFVGCGRSIAVALASSRLISPQNPLASARVPRDECPNSRNGQGELQQMNSSTRKGKRNKTVTTTVSPKPKQKGHVAKRPRHVAASTAKSAGKSTPMTDAPNRGKNARVRDGSKSAKILDLLKRTGGATLKEIVQITGWQPHSVRGFLSGTLGRKMGLTVDSTKRDDGERSYSLRS